MSGDEPTRCDTCGEPCQGGVKRYVDTAGHDRIGCEDEHACAAAYTRLGRLERRAIEAARIAGYAAAKRGDQS